MGIEIGDKFNRLTVIGLGKKDKVGRQYYKCQCDCGSPIKEVMGYHLKIGAVKSCGCLHVENGKKQVHNMWLARRKHFGCKYCGSDKHYAKGLCRNCYEKQRRGTLDKYF